MMKHIVIILLFIVGLVSCKNTEKTADKLQIAEHYFTALDKSNANALEKVVADSLLTSIPEYAYEVRYSKDNYLSNWLPWDSLFEPTYEVLEMHMEYGTVKAKVSKSDKRIVFFMGTPFITNEILSFKDDKIMGIETEYLNFDEETWGKNRTQLLNWTRENHPELNLDHNINVQTKQGGKKFLKAIELYQNQEL